MITPTAQPNVRVAHIDLKNPFDVEEKPDPAIIRRLIDAHMGPAEQKNAFDDLAPATADDIRQSHQNLIGRLQTARTNDNIYNALTRFHGGDKWAVNDTLQHLGYDGIQYPGGRILGTRPHQVSVVFQQAPSIGPPRWPAIKPSPPPK
jgi:hypothetical protein